LNRFLEIGTFLGKSASVLASVAKEQNWTLICIDYFVDNMEYWWEPKIVIPDTRNTFLSNMDRCWLMNNIISLKWNSTNYLNNLNGKFWLIYIDGGHTIKSVLPDALLCWGHILKKGFLIFHDYENENWEDVRIVVDVLMAKWKVKPYKISASKNMIAIQK
jgi:hypothetical protein